MKRRIVIGVMSALSVLVLILDAATAIGAAHNAVQLCIRVIIPSLFPFIVVTSLLSSTLTGMNMKCLSPLEKWMHLPAGSGSLFLCGTLGGYPSGAQLIHNAWKDGQIDKTQAVRMLAFCSNAGPAFLFGIVGPMIGSTISAWFIWGVHIVSAIVVGCVIPNKIQGMSLMPKPANVSVSAALKRGITVMASVCGWVILFRVIATFCSRWFLWYLPTELQVVFVALLELANGCTGLHLIENEGLRMIVASLAVNFGGLCVLMQTASVTGGLSIRYYIKGKLLQSLIAVILTFIVQYFLYPAHHRVDVDLIVLAASVLILMIVLYFLTKRKKSVDFPQKVLYTVTTKKRKG